MGQIGACERPNLVFVDDSIRAGSLFQCLSPLAQFSPFLFKPLDSSQLIDFLLNSSDHLLASPFFDSPFFLEVIKNQNFRIEAQITYGGEYQVLQEQVHQFLDHGHCLQVWFDRPSDLSIIRQTFADRWDQIKPVFWVSKNYDPHQLFEQISPPELWFIAAPKQNSLDSFLSLEEINLWTLKYSRDCILRPVFIEPLFLKFSAQTKDFYRSFAQESFQKLILSRKPLSYLFLRLFEFLKNINLVFIVELAKNLLLFVASPTVLGLQAIRHNISGKIKSVFSYTQWMIHRSLGKLKVTLEMAKIKSYWRAYRTGGSLKVFLVNCFWLVKSNLLRLFGALRSLAVSLYWFPKRVLSLLQIILIRLYWAVYQGLGKLKVTLEMAKIKSYWKAYRTGGSLKVFLVNCFWLVKSNLLRLFGALRSLAVSLYWFPKRVLSLLQIILIRLYWAIYRTGGSLKVFLVNCFWLVKSNLLRLFGALRSLTVSLYWFFFRISSWSINFIRNTLLWPLRRIYWFFEYHYQTNGESLVFLFEIILYFAVKTYHRCKIFLFFLLYPARKFIWFSSFQFKKRVLSKMRMSSEP